MTGMPIAERVLEELQRARRPLDDDELTRRLGVSRRQTINQVCRGLARSGRLRRHPGPDGKIVNDLGVADAVHQPSRTPIVVVPATDTGRQGSPAETPRGRKAVLRGYRITAHELHQAGFAPLELRITNLAVDLPLGQGCEWTTIGEVPRGPGLYAFTVETGQELRVAYVGLTEHLWMVTKGRLPEGGPRGGQRYGWPRHAGATRKRVNMLIAEQLRAGHSVRHWVRPLPTAALRAEEERLITRWNLRQVGWNRG
jgi:hypothetical protein